MAGERAQEHERADRAREPDAPAAVVVPVRAPSPVRVQTKLRVGAADDPAEREADRVAQQVLRNLAHPRTAATAPLPLPRPPAT